MGSQNGRISLENTEISILLNTEKFPILKFNNTEIFRFYYQKYELSDELNFEENIFGKA